MQLTYARKRVIITNVSPQVEEGKFPAKATVGIPVLISADVFGDGHDEIATAVQVKHKKERKWREIPMEFRYNDHWEYELVPEKEGIYQFKILGWADHFTTWHKGLKKKYDAQQNIAVELQIGAELLENIAPKASPKEKTQLQQWIETIKNPKKIKETLELVTQQAVTDIVRRYRDEDNTTTYDKTLDIEVERLKAGYSTWYELFPRSAAAEPGKHGTFNDVKKLIPRIARMGFDVLYFPPIHPIGKINRKGRNNSLTATKDDPGSPWAIGSSEGGHKAILPELGTLKDFKALVKEANKHHIEIAMDIAFQCAPDHPYVKEHPQWFKWRPDGTVQFAENPPKRYEDILPFNFETEDWVNLWNELKSVIEYWVAQGITIFRVDNPHTKALHFWEWMIPKVREKHPEVIFLAEAFTRPRIMERLAKAGFTQSYTYFTWRTNKQELQEYMTELTQTGLRDYFRPNFWPNTPDILPEHLVHGGENAHIYRLILAATLSSNYGLYGPVYEFGINTPYPGKEEYVDNEKYELKHWDWEHETRIGEIITLVNRIRRENTALHDTNNIQFAETTNDNIICYTKLDSQTNNLLIIAVNLDPHNTQSAHVKLPLEEMGIPPGRTYAVHDLLSGDKYLWHGEWNFVQLNPWEMPAHILRVENE